MPKLTIRAIRYGQTELLCIDNIFENCIKIYLISLLVTKTSLRTIISLSNYISQVKQKQGTRVGPDIRPHNRILQKKKKFCHKITIQIWSNRLPFFPSNRPYVCLPVRPSICNMYEFLLTYCYSTKI